MRNIRTDLAIEAHEMLTEAAEEIAGVDVQAHDTGNIHVTRVKIETPQAQQQMGKPMGSYITLEIPDLKSADNEQYETACRTLAEEIGSLITLNEHTNILVVGLGNWNITPDALGPQVVSKLMVTRHLLEYIPDQIGEGVRSVCAISPGVLGITGMETGEIIRGVVDKIQPDIVIAIDALAARNLERISSTIQICDTGISPGAGVGNKRKALNVETLGVPVIAIGIPTVIDAATITADTLNIVVDSMLKNADENSGFYKMLKSMDKDEQYALVKEVLSPHLADFMVTPKEVDLLIDRVSRMVANGINLALHDNLTFEDIEAFVA